MSAYIHPTAVVDEGAQLGENTKVWHFCHVEFWGFYEYGFEKKMFSEL